MSDAPDEYSNAWYRQQFKGVMHIMNRCNSDYIDILAMVRQLQEQVDTLKTQRELDIAEIGKLKESVARLTEGQDKNTERLDKAGEVVRELKKDIHKTG